MAVASSRHRRGRRAHGELESEVLAVLWSAGTDMSPGQVQARLSPGLAYNTVQTILTRLFDKGMLVREADGRTHLYRPAQARADLAAQQMHAVMAGGPDHAAVLQRFLDTMSEEDAMALRALLAVERDAPA